MALRDKPLEYALVLAGFFLLLPVSAIVFVQTVHGTVPTWMPATLQHPATTLSAARSHIARGNLDAARGLLQKAVQQAPYLGATWALWGTLIEQQTGLAAALPFYDHALSLDRYSRTNATFIAPRLHRAGWMATEELAYLAFRLDAPDLVAPLPATPPSTWPDAYQPVLGGATVYLLFRSGHDDWLAALEASRSRGALPADTRGYVLAGLCRSEAPACTTLAAACRTRSEPCPQGAVPRPVVAHHVSRALLATGQAEAAEWWARAAANQFPTADSVRNLAYILDAMGKTAESRQLLRLHPRLND